MLQQKDMKCITARICLHKPPLKWRDTYPTISEGKNCRTCSTVHQEGKYLSYITCTPLMPIVLLTLNCASRSACPSTISISSWIRSGGTPSPNMLKLLRKSMNNLNSAPVTSCKLWIPNTKNHDMTNCLLNIQNIPQLLGQRTYTIQQNKNKYLPFSPSQLHVFPFPLEALIVQLWEETPDKAPFRFRVKKIFNRKIRRLMQDYLILKKTNDLFTNILHSYLNMLKQSCQRSWKTRTINQAHEA